MSVIHKEQVSLFSYTDKLLRQRSFKVSCESISGIKDVMVFAPKTEFRPLSKRNVSSLCFQCLAIYNHLKLLCFH